MTFFKHKMVESQKYKFEQNKSETKEHSQYDSTYIKFEIRQKSMWSQK